MILEISKAEQDDLLAVETLADLIERQQNTRKGAASAYSRASQCAHAAKVAEEAEEKCPTGSYEERQCRYVKEQQTAQAQVWLEAAGRSEKQAQDMGMEIRMLRAMVARHAEYDDQQSENVALDPQAQMEIDASK